MLRLVLLSLSIAACGDDSTPADAGVTRDGFIGVVDAGPPRSDSGSSDAGDGLEDCDPMHVSCRALPPACVVGEAASVIGDCWGPCVSAERCRPIECADSDECPVDWACGPDMRCGPPIAMR
jgi:hypothetical protein